jgi:hypothetical protein
MLQRGDEKWISQVMSPMAFKLVDGRVFVAANGEREDGPEVKYVDASGPDAPRPMPQAEIEALVLDLKRGEHRSNIATDFEDQLALLNSVYSSGQTLGYSPVGEKPDSAYKAWAEWGRNVFAQFDQARTASDVRLPRLPDAPKWHPHVEVLREEIERLNSA